jgi:hypothetical protein
MMQARWDRLATVEVMCMRTMLEFTEKVEESYGLSHEQATRDGAFRALDKQL